MYNLKREDILNSLVTSMNVFENNPAYTSRISALISELRSLDIQKQFVTMYEYLNKELHDIAIEEGSNMLRIGSAIFGKRS